MGVIGFDRIVLIGSIFYSRHRIVEDPVKGIFDENKAEQLINLQEEMEDKFNITGLLDVVSEGKEAIVKYMDFVADRTDKPFILDGYLEARIAGLKYASEVGLVDRIIYNSINTMNTADEIKALKEASVESAIIFCYDPAYTTPFRRLILLTEKGLLKRAEDIGIKNLLVDVVPTDIKSLGEVIETLLLIKTTYNYPAGCGPANVSYYLSDFLKEEIDTTTIVSSVNAVSHLFSDFLFYGPIERAEIAFGSAYIVEEVKEGLSSELHKLMVRT
ncbi:Tetrahydromethanopterin S-methyltransferase, subunit H [Archaeoglobus sulfaticallidus PM70-1]|uniref:Tetrahydromethanopterin S-methyltransferase, subunit H n=1 Tax=Archaeoglobus sulfaticallidus PM70-1 TaxID=387631 RepID=N0BKC9_9EURY|nr:tetrahydromethanopterin S-methyltransferase subunit H [Archaeoglobus sulfaticallidus]AGK60620.1 Tetrahydromethanopterin S-methyltransferase, subunit H [Archaeoglobus sulfaticallidus PM70-1]